MFECCITECGIEIAGEFDDIFKFVEVQDETCDDCFVLRNKEKGFNAEGYVVNVDGTDYPLDVQYYEDPPTENVQDNVYSLLSNIKPQDPDKLSETIENAETIDAALDAAVRIVAMVSGSTNDIEDAQDCEEWHEVDYGDYIYYWCYVYSKTDGQGTLPYKIERIISECFEDQEYVWAGLVEARPWPDEADKDIE